MSSCDESPDFIYPMTMDVYYPMVEQGIYGNVQKHWVKDRTLVCNLSPAGSAGKEEIKPNMNIVQETIIFGRSKSDVRVSAQDSNNAITNIVISNVSDKFGKSIYLETSGPRSGKATIFEIVSNDPIVGPFGSVDYYRITLKRSENQAVDI